MKEHQITFFIDKINIENHLILTLSHKANKFQCSIYIVNISKNCQYHIYDLSSIFKSGFSNGDLCQITTCGIDAKLAYFELKQLISANNLLVKSQNNNSLSNQLAQQITQLNFTYSIQWYYTKESIKLEKSEYLNKLAKLIHPNQPNELYSAFVKREKYTSTYVMPGIALPHTIFHATDCISIAVITNNIPVEWHSKEDNVNMVIGLVIPSTPTREQFIAVTNFSRNLLNEKIVERLLKTRESIDLQVIMMHMTSRLIP